MSALHPLAIVALVGLAAPSVAAPRKGCAEVGGSYRASLAAREIAGAPGDPTWCASVGGAIAVLDRFVSDAARSSGCDVSALAGIQEGQAAHLRAEASRHCVPVPGR